MDFYEEYSEWLMSFNEAEAPSAFVFGHGGCPA
jgi:hypothetical protein